MVPNNWSIDSSIRSFSDPSRISGFVSISWQNQINLEYPFKAPPYLCIECKRSETRGVKLLYFFANSPVGSQSDSQRQQLTPLTFSDALNRVRDVKYDRGQIRDSADSEALAMADCLRRIESFTRSEIYQRGYFEGFQLAIMGFFHIENINYPDAIKCSFCKKVFDQGTNQSAVHISPILISA